MTGQARTLPPLAGDPTPVRFPTIAREELSSGLRVWSLPWRSLPVITVALLIEGGSADDPPGGPGLVGLTADLVDEGAGGRDAVELTDAFARLGTHLETDVGQDATLLWFTTLARNLEPALALLADVIVRPHLAESDLLRVRDLRLSRLRQLKTSASAAADRAFLEGVFGSHPYGHGTLGTSPLLRSASADDVRRCHERLFIPARATLIVAGDRAAHDVVGAARAGFGGWRVGRLEVAREVDVPSTAPPAVLLVDRPGAPQSELRIGHLGPPRNTPAYPALVTLNAALGGQFTSRINRQLRETRGYTYGARTGLDFRRTCSTFACETSVQSNATVEAVGEVLDEFAAVGASRPIAGDELVRARESLTRGYVRQFETAAHLVRAVVDLVKFRLPDDAFDRFVPDVRAVTEPDVQAVAQAVVRPAECVTVVVGDAAQCRDGLSRFGTVVEMMPEF